MKTPSVLRPVREWFKTVGQIGKRHHASDLERGEPEVIKSPPHHSHDEKKKKK